MGHHTHRVYILCIMLLWSFACREEDQVRFGIVYSKITPEQVVPYNVIILEPDHYSKTEVDALKADGRLVIAYISLGEVNPSRWYFPYLEDRGFLGVNENWGSHYLRLDDEGTRRVLLDKVLPNIMIKGFDGLFLDTVDAVAPYATDRAHLQSSMVTLISALDQRHPDAYIIQNAGLFLLDQTTPHIDAVLVEDVASMYNFDTQTYAVKPDSAFQEKSAMLQEYETRFDRPVWVVDFADSIALKEQLIKRLAPLPFPYFISTIDLTTLPADHN